MPDLSAVLAWLTELPPLLLLGAMALLALLENVFPPIPADVLVAFGALIAARGHGSPWPSFVAVWGGSVSGAILMFLLGRRFGSAWIERRFRIRAGGAADVRLRALHERYGVVGLFISRFLPGIRSIVPPVAGALGLRLHTVIPAVALASALWYGLVTMLAFRAGNNWEVLAATVGSLGRWTALIALGLGVLLVGAWWMRRRRRARDP